MDAIPPQRKNAPKVHFHRTRFTPLQMLSHLGISRHRAYVPIRRYSPYIIKLFISIFVREKALAATGNQSAKAAMNWLVSHVDDINLDENEMREYALVAVPFGPVYDQLLNFWEDSKDLTGWNDAHNTLPHIMLVPFFQVIVHIYTFIVIQQSFITLGCTRI